MGNFRRRNHELDPVFETHRLGKALSGEEAMNSKLSRTPSLALVTFAFALASLTAHAQWAPTATLTASDGQATDFFGGSLAVYGNTLVVGALGRNFLTGVAYVFTESNAVWTQVAELTP